MTTDRAQSERLAVAESLEEYAMIHEAEGGNPYVIAAERGEPVAWIAFDANGFCELFLEEENAKFFAGDKGYYDPLVYPGTPPEHGGMVTSAELAEEKAEISGSVRSFVYALLGANTWVEAGKIWDKNPEERKAAHAFFCGDWE